MMVRIPERLPLAFSERTSAVVAALLERNGEEVEVAIGGVPFRLATYEQAPQSTTTIPLRKQQFDNEPDPGEQSLGFWWRRSQDSWHEGAGNLYQENREDAKASSGFYDSKGVNVWTKGQLSLLSKMQNGWYAAASWTTIGRLSLYTSAGALKLSAIVDGQFWTGAPSFLIATHTPGGKTLVDGIGAGLYFYDVASDGTLYQGLLSSPGTASSWALTGGTPFRLAFGQFRLWVIGGRNIWQPDLAGGGLAPKYTHPNQGWTYTSMADGPSGMYFAGHDGRSSSIQRIGLDAAGGIPTLTGATSVASFPDGELVQEIAILAGQFIGIGTTKGFRVGALDANGGIAYGPILFTPTGLIACTAIQATGTFFRVAFNSTDKGETYKIDTSLTLSEGVYPYARDLECNDGLSGYVTSLSEFDNSGRAVAVTSSGTSDGSYFQEAADGTKVATGYLQTGRIRFRTSENKLFRSIELETQPLVGTIQVQGIEESGTFFDVQTMISTGEAGTPPLGITSNLGPQRQMAFKFTLAPSGTTSPILNSYLVRALPSVKPQREIVLPLLCFDQETGKSGQRYGHQGFAAERISQLQALEDVGDLVVFQDFTSLVPSGQTCIVNSIQFIQTAPPSIAQGAGGILLVKLGTAAV